jgi:signal transduction histidine kinase
MQKCVEGERRKKEEVVEMLSFASHQMKSPLAAIMGYAEMVYLGETGLISRKQRRVVGTMCRATENLSRIVDDFLDISIVEQGGLRYEMDRFDVAILAKEIVCATSMRMRGKRCQISIEVDGRMPYSVLGDREKVRHVFINLIDNAIQHTPKGNIRVRVFKDRSGGVCFRIADTGEGILPADLLAIFRKFRQAEGRRGSSGGSGLGLYLAKIILSAHGGRIWAESGGLGKGAAFTVVLPAAS